jgi:hypothetical protein
MSAAPTPAPIPTPTAEPVVTESLGRLAQFGFGLYMIATQVLVVYLLIRVWPKQIPLSNEPELMSLFGAVHSISLETRFLLIVVLSELSAVTSTLPRRLWIT